MGAEPCALNHAASLRKRSTMVWRFFTDVLFPSIIGCISPRLFVGVTNEMGRSSGFKASMIGCIFFILSSCGVVPQPKERN